MATNKKILVISVVLIGLSVGVFSLFSTPSQAHNQDVFGTLIRNQIWSGQIRVTGDILVMPWVTLTILPGTTVVVSANQDIKNLFGQETCDGVTNYDLLIGTIEKENDKCGAQPNEPYRDEAHHVSIIIRGTLMAVGTKDNRITFKSDSSDPTRYDWNRLEINKGTLSYTNVSNYRILGVLGEDIELKNNILSNIGECGICMNGGNATVLSNFVSDAGHELVDMHNSSPSIRNNYFGPNPNLSCVTIDGGRPEIIGNIFEGCGSAVSLLTQPSDLKFENSLRKDNIFLNNVEVFYYEYK